MRRSRQFKPMSENDPNPPVAVFCRVAGLLCKLPFAELVEKCRARAERSGRCRITAGHLRTKFTEIGRGRSALRVDTLYPTLRDRPKDFDRLNNVFI